MKTNLLALALCLAGLTCYGQDENKVDVPQAARDAFTKAFAAAQDVEWEVEDGTYEVEFELAGQEKTATYSATGELLEVETEMKPSALPAAVLAAAKAGGYKVKKAEMIEAKGTTFYELEALKGGKEMELLLDAKGKMLQLPVVEQDYDDDDEDDDD
jgi:uncharacterized membrane protein YkoI